MKDKKDGQQYYTFTRTKFGTRVRDRGGLTLEAAQKRCADFNHSRTVADIVRDTIMDFSRE